MGETVEMRFDTLLGQCTLTREELVLEENEEETRLPYTAIDNVFVREKTLGAHPVLVIERNGEEWEIPVRTVKLGREAVDVIRRYKANRVTV